MVKLYVVCHAATCPSKSCKTGRSWKLYVAKLCRQIGSTASEGKEKRIRLTEHVWF
jgi:hypothetical protein